jgi:hypothetical protein
VDPARFAARFPWLYHMAHFGTWNSIERNGLLSTSRLLDLFEVQGPTREHIESDWRSTSIAIEHPVHGRAVIRDQLPLRPDLLARRLNGGMTPADWYQTLNRYVFFWVDEAHLMTLLNARAYRDQAQTVIVLDTALVLKRYLPTVRLSSINSGSILRGGAFRGLDTFVPINDYARPGVVELCVEGAVRDVGELAHRVEHRWPDGQRELVFPPT